MKLTNICAIIALSGLVTLGSSMAFAEPTFANSSFMKGFNAEEAAAGKKRYDELSAKEKNATCKPIVSDEDVRQCGLRNVIQDKSGNGPTAWYCCEGPHQKFLKR